MKWEYKTIDFKSRADFDQNSPLLGDEGWELAGTTSVNGWIVANYKRQLNDDPITDVISNLITLVSDPDKSLKLIGDLKAAREKAIAASAVADGKKQEAEDKIKEANLKSVEADKKQTEVDKQLREIDATRTILQSAQAAHQTLIDKHAQVVKEHNQKVASDLKDVDMVRSNLTEAIVVYNRNSTNKETELQKREQAVEQREVTLSLKEKESAEFATKLSNLIARK